jgi:cellulose synthase/poly-beta-1,6-N-acetylglucosamine synthase-like glycosyltransferase
VVVARDADEPTHLIARAFSDRLPLELVLVTEPGTVHALNAGLPRVKGGFVAITDDDAAPHRDWLMRIATHFGADDRIGGVGGRDWVHMPDGAVVEGERRLVGRVQWFGRIVGNHHLGVGRPREVDIFKGANMSFRRAAIEGLHFDIHLRGLGAQPHNDLYISLAVKKNGWKLIYDPAVAVDHYPAARFDVDQRGVFHPEATENSAYNLMWATQTQLAGWRRLATRYWQFWIGQGLGEPGYLRMIQVWRRRERHLLERLAAAQQGRRNSIRDLGMRKGNL